MISETIHVKTTAAEDGSVSRTRHEVWDKEKYLLTRQIEQIDVLCKDGKTRSGRVELITREEWREHNGNWAAKRAA